MIRLQVNKKETADEGKGMTGLLENILLGLKVALIIVEIILILVMAVWIIDAFKKRPK